MHAERHGRAIVCVIVTAAVCVAVGCDGGAGAGAPAAVPTASPDGGARVEEAGAQPKPFAGSLAEATELISAAIDKRSSDVRKCVEAYRARKNAPRERVDIAVGIDQEGTLLGATLTHGRRDDALSSCVMDALRSAVFPRSHSGVISVTKSYEELVQ